jgi:hypothetical protein
MGRIIMDAILIEFRLSNMDREGDFCLSRSWKILSALWKMVGSLSDMTADLGSPRGTRVSVHCPYQAIKIPSPLPRCSDVQMSFRCICFFTPTACLWLTHLTSHPCPAHLYNFILPFFLYQ